MEPRPRPELPPNIAPPARQLPAGGNKLQRISQHGRGVVDDLKSWVDLKITLTKLEIKEELNRQKELATLYAIAGGLGLLGAVFGLITLGLALGAILDIWLSTQLSYCLGFLIVTLILLIGAGIFFGKARDVQHQEHPPA